jgi:hypothetical protein
LDLETLIHKKNIVEVILFKIEEIEEIIVQKQLHQRM